MNEPLSILCQAFPLLVTGTASRPGPAEGWAGMMWIGAAAVLLVLLVFLAMTAWSLTLRKQVRRRTNELEQELAERLRGEVERSRLEDQLRQSQKMEAVGQLAGGIAHDFNNLLTAILGNAQLLTSSLPPDSQEAGQAAQITQAASRAARFTEQLLAYSRKTPLELTVLDIHRVIQDVVGLLAHSIDRRVRIEQVLQARPSTVRGDPGQLQNALLNIGLNARDAMSDGGTLTFTTGMVEIRDEADPVRSGRLEPGSYLELSIRDTGIGMSPERQARIFEPFFTTKRQGEGTGLGLASVYGCVEKHGGWIEVHSTPGKGSTFRVLLPSVTAPAEIPPEILDEEPTRGRGHLLVVDDEEGVRRFLRSALERLGYQVTTCQDGLEALGVYRAHQVEFHLVILDLMMPRMSGEQTLKLLREFDPEVRVLIASGYSHGEAQDLLAAGALGYVRKPFRIEELSRQVARCMPRPTLTSELPLEDAPGPPGIRSR